MSRRVREIAVSAVIFMAVLIVTCSAVVAPPGVQAGEQAQIRIVDASGKEILTNPPPVVVEGHTLVPLFSLAKVLQAQLSWDDTLDSAMLTDGQNVILFRVGSDQAKINGNLVSLGVTARVVGGRIYVPLAVVAGALGAQVTWNGATGTVSLAPNAENGLPGAATAGPGIQGVPADSLTIKVGYFGGPYYTKRVYRVSDLSDPNKFEQVQQAYTYIDNMPAVVIDSGRGVKFSDLLADAGIDVNSIEKFYFYSTDVKVGWYEDLDKDYLLDTPRYYYPNLPSHWDYGMQSSLPGATDGAVRVDTIIAYWDNWKRFVRTPNFNVHDKTTAFRLLFGQTDTSTHTAYRSVMWVHEIDVLLGGAPPSGIVLSQDMANLKVGSSFQLTATVTPTDATDKSVTWTSSNSKVAKVDSKGTVTVVGTGMATITASTVVGNYTATCIVNGPLQGGVTPTGAMLRTPAGTPVSDQQYLAEGNTAAANAPSTSASSGQSGNQPWRVYEMSPGAVPLLLQKDQGRLDFYVTLLFLVLFSLGLARRYVLYAREVKK